jgi:hypothetical protein
MSSGEARLMVMLSKSVSISLELPYGICGF